MENLDIVNNCLKEMFKRVGLEYPNIELTDKPDWYWKYEWTEDEENDFKLWMVKYLQKYSDMVDYYIDKEVGWFLLSYGWKTKG